MALSEEAKERKRERDRLAIAAKRKRADAEHEAVMATRCFMNSSAAAQQLPLQEPMLQRPQILEEILQTSTSQNRLLQLIAAHEKQREREQREQREREQREQREREQREQREREQHEREREHALAAATPTGNLRKATGQK